MQVFHSKSTLRAHISSLENQQFSLGIVPTMGALHTGHISLVSAALSENSVVVVSIFVNPTQFDKAEDLEKYPKTLDRDLALLQKVSKEILVFAPSAAEIYPHGNLSKSYDFEGLDTVMEGAFREGHFNGVGTIVEELFRIVQPKKAYFGEKDFQQLQIIKKLVELRKIPVEIIGCPIVREPHGLAMSSRNERLTSALRKEAAFIYATLLTAKTKFGTKSANYICRWVEQQFKNHPSLRLEYIAITDVANLKPVARKRPLVKYRAFIAVYAEDVRLIDNIALN